MENLRKSEQIRKHMMDYYNGFTLTSETVADETGFSIKEVATVLSRIKDDGKLVKIRWEKKKTGGKQLVYMKVHDIDIFILPPSKTENKSGPKPKEYVPPDTESEWYRFNYGGVLRC